MQQAQRIAAIQKKLLAWYKKHQRDLPWRRTRDPYAIWVSEIMLQQTQVATVIPYYERFLKRFPTVQKLARAREQSVLKLWEGLGYYSRARNLQKAARSIIQDHNGQIPQSADQLHALPGIGPYTAGAIASIAFDLDEPVLDGNVIRVLSRLFRLKSNPEETAAKKKLWQLAEKMVPAGKASFFNQALMDLGATTCTPRKASCVTCPVSALCLAKKSNLQEVLPVKTKAKPLPHHHIGVGVIWKKDKILIDRRKPAGLLGGLWEFPGGKQKKSETLPACVRREVLEELAVKVKVGKSLITVKHAYSHFKITLHVYSCRYLSGNPKAIACTAWKWVKVSELEKFPFPAANLKIIEKLKDSVSSK